MSAFRVWQAAELQRTVEQRMAVWLRMPFPYGSEFAWDSTGHEEISTWMLRFGRLAEARQTLDAVTAYTQATPHWAYCGSARRWWGARRPTEHAACHARTARRRAPDPTLATRAQTL